MIRLEAYREIAPQGIVDFLYRMAEKMQGKKIIHVNSTKLGGGVAEILRSLVPLLQSVGLDAQWEVIGGNEEFFSTTKAFHNALQGQEQKIPPTMLENYLEVNRENAQNISLDADFVVIHDPQPAALIQYRPPKGKWIWRCHIDVSQPQRKVWDFLRQFVVSYDGTIFSLPRFAQRLPIPQFLIHPSIDPLSDKNRDLTPEEQQEILRRLEVSTDKPILLQVSRFDRFKDPLGVIQAYRLVKKHHDLRLVLAGGGATDDPEGETVLEEVREAAQDDPDIQILLLPPDAYLEINALQRAAAIVLQKSLREGFGLTVAEAMWKGKPVIGGFTGGITVQLVYGVTGFTVNSVEGAAFRIHHLLDNPEVMNKMGQDAREFVRRNFLITRHLGDYLALINYVGC
ncbi:MAG: glycosyl transferase family 1 [Deltaproteobacteria bacterium SM23_61]|nr:MAG: glycosyl transferase family 1 [Deltaproteobacteria bacterium SM23_61]